MLLVVEMARQVALNRFDRVPTPMLAIDLLTDSGSFCTEAAGAICSVHESLDSFAADRESVICLSLTVRRSACQTGYWPEVALPVTAINTVFIFIHVL